MLTKKLLVAVGLAGALLVGVATDASANPWHGPHFRPVPTYRPVVRAPIYAPVYRNPVVYAPSYTPVYQTPVYVPAYRRHHAWGHVHGHRW